MISVLLWICVLSSGSVLAAVVWNRRYEEILPITCSGIIGILFLFGAVGKLRYGAYFIILLSVTIYAYSLYITSKKKIFRKIISKLVTPASVLFFVFVVLVCYCNYGRRAYTNDEFSHWMDIVKVAATMDAFGTHPDANSIFPTYPPGMVLFQYMFQKIDGWCCGTIFSEWGAYVAYQVLVISFLLIMIKDLNFKRIVNALLSVIILLICPIIFFPSLYTSTYIDPVLGILTGCGMIRVLVEKQKDIIYDTYIIAISCMLVLMKDAGMLFSLFLIMFYNIDTILGKCVKCSRGDYKIRLISKCIKIVVSFGSAFLCKGIWEWHIKWMGAAKNFSTPYDISVIWNVILGRDTGYKGESWNNFWTAFVNKDVILEGYDISISHLIFIIFLICILVIVTSLYAIKDKQIKKSVIFIIMEILLMIVYIMGLGITYITKFSEYEALKLASFNRYMDIGYLSLFFAIISLLLYVINCFIVNRKIVSIFLLFVVLHVMPYEETKGFLAREEVQKSQEVYIPYSELISNVEEYCEDGTRIYYIAQETSGYERLLLCYATRPVKGNVYVSASIGEPFYEGDIFTRVISPKDWRSELMQEYDYVGLFKVNDYFVEEYGGLFESLNDIVDGGVYKVNRETGSLTRCK